MNFVLFQFIKSYLNLSPNDIRRIQSYPPYCFHYPLNVNMCVRRFDIILFFPSYSSWSIELDLASFFSIFGDIISIRPTSHVLDDLFFFSLLTNRKVKIWHIIIIIFFSFYCSQMWTVTRKVRKKKFK